MKNPFEKLANQGDSSSVEEKKVVDTNYEVRDDDVYVQDVYEDGVGEWTELGVNPVDSDGARKAYKEYRTRRGIVEEADL